MIPGRYDYAYRFSYNGSSWLYCDMRGSGPPDNPGGGSSDGYDPADAGDLWVYPAAHCQKWHQPPDCDFGLDLPSYGLVDQGGSVVTMSLVADDWLCDGRPITAIGWWGSYVGWPGTEPPLSDRPLGFELTWYHDIPAGDPAPTNSQPGVAITNIQVQLLPFGVPVQGPGFVSETNACVVIKDPASETEFYYYVKLEAPWNEKEGEIYWLSIEALYDAGEAPPQEAPDWGWATSYEIDIIDDAVVWVPDGGPQLWQELIWPVYPYPEFWTQWAPFTLAPVSNPSLNMAYELYTDVCPRRTKKWDQPPDMVTGVDLWSWTRKGEQGSGGYLLRADDFISDGRRITDIHWWGSYSNWMTDTWGSKTNPVPPPMPPMAPLSYQPVGFYLSWHTNDVEACKPGALLEEHFVPIENCHEVYYGTVDQRAWVPTNYYEHEYQYYVDLWDVEGPWNEQAGGHYWLNIQAAFTNNFEPSQAIHAGWGWKVTGKPVSECPSMVSPDNGLSWQQATFPAGHLKEFQLTDLAFELTTDEVSTNDPGGPIVITNIAINPLFGGYTLKSVGTYGAGLHSLQYCTNLLVSNDWQILETRTTVFPRPMSNTWYRTPSYSNEFYRIHEQ